MTAKTEVVVRRIRAAALATFRALAPLYRLK